MTQPKLAAQVEDDSIAVDLGDIGVDQVTLFTGRVTAIALYDHSSPSVQLEALVDGEIVHEWIDAARVKRTEPKDG